MQPYVPAEREATAKEGEAHGEQKGAGAHRRDEVRGHVVRQEAIASLAGAVHDRPLEQPIRVRTCRWSQLEKCLPTPCNKCRLQIQDTGRACRQL